MREREKQQLTYDGPQWRSLAHLIYFTIAMGGAPCGLEGYRSTERSKLLNLNLCSCCCLLHYSCDIVSK